MPVSTRSRMHSVVQKANVFYMVMFHLSSTNCEEKDEKTTSAPSAEKLALYAREARASRHNGGPIKDPPPCISFMYY